MSDVENRNLCLAISNLIDKGAINECEQTPGHFLSPYFLVKKPNKSFRFILNLKELNKFIDIKHFKLEDYKTAIKLIENDYYMGTVDLQDAYYMISIALEDRKFLRFRFNGKLYEFTCLVFGLCTPPQVFTKIMKPIIQFLRKLGHKSVLYLHDFLLLGETEKECAENIHITIHTLTKVGFIINIPKSNTIPSKTCLFLGFCIDSSSMTIQFPQKKRKNIRTLVDKFSRISSCKIRDFARFIGSITACCPALKYSWLYTKDFERQKFLALAKNNINYNNVMQLCLNNIDLAWWKDNILSGVNTMKNYNFEMEIFSDASLTEWGAAYGQEKANGFWNTEERNCHIHFLELKAAFFALKCFANYRKNIDILLRIDNTTAIAYINRMGGIQFEKLNCITKEIWQWGEIRNISIFASYIKSKENYEADFESRKLEPETKFELSQVSFERIVNILGKLQIDLFASRTNKKCKRYVSWKQDPGSENVDAFTICWKNIAFYAFPPFSIILKTLQKIKRDKAEEIVLVPDWPCQPWFPIFHSMKISEVLIFSPNEQLLSSSDRTPHPLWKSLTLVAAK